MLTLPALRTQLGNSSSLATHTLALLLTPEFVLGFKILFSIVVLLALYMNAGTQLNIARVLASAVPAYPHAPLYSVYVYTQLQMSRYILYIQIIFI